MLLQCLRHFVHTFSNPFLTIQVSLTGITVISGRLVSNSGVCYWDLLGSCTAEDPAHHSLSSLLQGCAFPSWVATAISHFMLQGLLQNQFFLYQLPPLAVSLSPGDLSLLMTEEQIQKQKNLESVPCSFVSKLLCC